MQPYTNPYTIEEIVRMSAAVIELLTASPRAPVDISGVSERLEIPLEVSQQLCSALIMQGSIVENSAGELSLGPMTAAVGTSVASDFPYITPIRQILPRISQMTGLTTLATMVLPQQLMVFGKADPAQGEGDLVRPGISVSNQPPFGFAHSAWLDDAGFDQWLAMSEIVAGSELAGRYYQLRERVRQCGYIALDLASPMADFMARYSTAHARGRALQVEGQLHQDLCQLAADFPFIESVHSTKRYYPGTITSPVFNQLGECVLFLGISGLPDGSSGERLLDVVEMLLHESRALTGMLDGHFPCCE